MSIVALTAAVAAMVAPRVVAMTSALIHVTAALPRGVELPETAADQAAS